jgi:putative membrane protein
MNRALLICAAAASALSLAACQRQEAATNEANPGQSEPVNAAQDAVSAAVGQTSAATLGANTTGGYVSNAAMGDMFEIQSSQMAQQKGQNQQVKDLAKMIIADHTQAMNEMKPLVQQAGETPPTELDQRRKGMIDNLTAASGAEFDKTYITQQIAAHQEAITLHEGYSNNGDNAALKAHAAKVLPKIRAHLERAQQIQQTMGEGGQAAPAKK